MPKTFREFEGAYARLEGGGRHDMALMLRDASQRAWAVEAPALASRCDAPQHEGERARQVDLNAVYCSIFPHGEVVSGPMRQRPS